MRVGIVINPIAGRRGSRPGETARRRAFVQSRAAAAGLDATIALTERGGHARQLAQAFVDEGCETVIAMGGDGTVNEVAQALVGTTTALGILPCGSGDGLAQGLGLLTNPERAMRIALSSESTAIDVGYAGDRIFLNIAGIGFDAAVGRLFANRSTRGALGYVTTVIGLVWTYVAPQYEVSWNTGETEEKRQGRKFLVGFANTSTYGNGAVLAPDADPRDGVLDLVLVDAGGPLQQVWRSRRLFWRRRAAARGMERSRAIRATVRGPAIVCHVDGEVFETSGSLEISVRPRALLVRTEAVSTCG
jgi:diacylglycerol kinase (ATP)